MPRREMKRRRVDCPNSDGPSALEVPCSLDITVSAPAMFRLLADRLYRRRDRGVKPGTEKISAEQKFFLEPRLFFHFDSCLFFQRFDKGGGILPVETERDRGFQMSFHNAQRRNGREQTFTKLFDQACILEHELEREAGTKIAFQNILAVAHEERRTKIGDLHHFLTVFRSRPAFCARTNPSASASNSSATMRFPTSFIAAAFPFLPK